ncbi:hypothetical protein JZ751_029426 [Albula glossodonta]|uniref:Uncharacterized protein n=1 Tax=Albula glossodonta TaxID=121402 RepID=A0A8T2PBL4_9TELE|nr:hypothetical protein JZ751_029426 [Albula glossodonta]
MVLTGSAGAREHEESLFLTFIGTGYLHLCFPHQALKKQQCVIWPYVLTESTESELHFHFNPRPSAIEICALIGCSRATLNLYVITARPHHFRMDISDVSIMTLAIEQLMMRQEEQHSCMSQSSCSSCSRWATL